MADAGFIAEYGLHLDKLDLIWKSGKTINLVPVYLEFYLYQSIIMPFMHIDLYFQDPQDIMEKNEFQGGEILDVSFSSGMEEDGKKIEKRFECYAVASILQHQYGESGKQKIIHLKFFEEGWKNFFFKKVSKAYKDKTGNEIVQEHLGEVCPEINLKGCLESEQRIKLFTMPYWNSNTMIHYIQRKISQKDGVALFASKVIPKEDVGYLFFSNSNGHWFTTISDLLGQEVLPINQMFLAVDADNAVGDRNQSYSQTLTWELSFNIFKSMAKSQFGSDVHYMNVKTGNAELHTFKLDTYLDTTTTIGKYSNIHDDYLKWPDLPEFTKYNPRYIVPSFYEVDDDNFKSGVNDFMWWQRVKLLNDNRFEFLFAQNLNLMAGTLFNFYTKSYRRDQEHKALTGNYLATDITHCWKGDAYWTLVGAAKDAYSDMETKTHEITEQINPYFKDPF
jgi:hypothetical protein